MWRFVNKSILAVCLSGLCLLMSSCASDLKGRVEAMVEAHNSHDVERELSFYTDDARYEMVGAWVRQGKEELRRLLEKDAIFNSQIFLTDVEVAGDVVTCQAKEQNDLFMTAGIDALDYEFWQFGFEDGLIKAVRAKHTKETTAAMKELTLSFRRWVSERRSQESADLRFEGGLTEENASKVLKLVREWREDMKGKKQ